jgi:TPR repeat protein
MGTRLTFVRYWKSLMLLGLLAPALASAEVLPARAEHALEHGDVRAIERLAARYDQGRGMAPDPVAAAALYRDAARRGSGAAQLNLAQMYLEGRGVPPDPVEAYAWADAAAANGEPGGERIIDQLAEVMPKAQRERARSRAARYVELYVPDFRTG